MALVQYRLLLVCIVPILGHALAFNPKFGNQFSQVLDRISFRSRADEVRNSTAVLEHLGITSSIKPRPFSARPQQFPAVLAAFAPAVLRLGSGLFAQGYKVSITDKDPSKYSVVSFGGFQISETSEMLTRQQQVPLVIYEFEACPFCRKVREAVSILGLSVTYLPCPKNGRIHRPEIKSKYGEKSTFPFLIDMNTGIEMFESDTIVTYLFKTYGDGKVPGGLSSGPLVLLTAGIGMLARGGKGGTYKLSNPPTEPVVLWAYEGSPFCKLVREELCALEIPHTQISTPRGSPNRQIMFEEAGRFQAPYIQDPNTGVNLFESEAILEYLQKQYGVDPSPVKYL